MIDHTGINVSNIALSREFYKEALKPLGYKICLDLGTSVGFGSQQNMSDDPGGDFWISEATPHLPKTHIAFRAKTHDEVKAFYEAAIKCGGTCNGAPGVRPHYHASYYAAFVLDLDGYNIEAVCHR